MTAMTGAIRYMAPEVGLGKPYNLTADVYSWSIIMWYILAIEPPFGLYTNEMIKDRIMKRGSRPAIFHDWPEALSSLMKRCWDDNLRTRPPFSDILKVLRTEMIDSDTLVGGSVGSGESAVNA